MSVAHSRPPQLEHGGYGERSHHRHRKIPAIGLNAASPRGKSVDMILTLPSCAPLVRS